MDDQFGTHTLPRPDAGEVIEMLPQTSDAVLVATDDTGTPIGATWWHFPQPPLMRATDGSPVPEMIVAVTTAEQGHGIGTALIHALVAKAAGEFDQLALNVHIRNPAARLYSRTGFQVAGKGRGPLGVAMVKTLRQGAMTELVPIPTPPAAIPQHCHFRGAKHCRLLSRHTCGTPRK